MFLSKIGGVYYVFSHDETGKRNKVSTKCKKKSKAFAFLLQFQVEEHQKKQNLKRIILSDFVKQYFEYASGVLTKKTYTTYQTAFRELIRVEGDKPLQSIGIREIEHFLSVKKVEASEWSTRKYYISLASAFEKAVQWSFLEHNPFRKVTKPKVSEIVPAYFTESEFRTFLFAVRDTDFRDLVLTAILSGLRLGELLSLQWSDVDFNAKVILVRNTDSFTTKTRRNRVVPINEELWRLLKERKQIVRFECETVFYDQKGSKLKEGTVSQKFKRYVRRAGLNDNLHLHSLRHSFATALVKAAVPLYSVSKLLGHASSAQTTELYAHLQPEQLYNEVNKINLELNLDYYHRSVC